MPIAMLNSKGQITLPMSVRNALRLSAGALVNFLPVDGSFVLVPVRSDVSSLKGRFAGRVKKPVSVEAMNEAKPT
jgi:antitoxin PrlF